jgi:hypothetical protein
MNKEEVEELLKKRKQDLCNKIAAYSELPNSLKSEYEKRRMIQCSSRLLEVSLILQKLGIKDAE